MTGGGCTTDMDPPDRQAEATKCMELEPSPAEWCTDTPIATPLPGNTVSGHDRPGVGLELPSLGTKNRSLAMSRPWPPQRSYKPVASYSATVKGTESPLRYRRRPSSIEDVLLINSTVSTTKFYVSSLHHIDFHKTINALHVACCNI